MLIDAENLELFCAWDDALRPIGESTSHKEPFDIWWKRCGQRLNHLHPMIAEQWIYRHWTHSVSVLKLLEFDGIICDSKEAV